LTARLKTMSEAPDCAYELLAVWVASKLVPQAQNVHVHGSISNSTITSPDGF
jgi:hypothetical protein